MAGVRHSCDCGQRKVVLVSLLLLVFVVFSALHHETPLPDGSGGGDRFVLNGRHHKLPPGSRHLPSLENGGVVFMLHIPKTGGTTIRELVKFMKNGKRSEVDYVYLTGQRDLEHTMRQMNRWLSNSTRVVEARIDSQEPADTVHFVEYHALDRNCATFLEISSTLLPQWKRLAEERQVPFFLFSIVREPISLAVSFFNYYRAMEQNPNRFDLIPSDNATEDVFLQATIANPQCLFLTRNEDSYTKTGQDLRDSLTWQECQQAFSGLLDLSHWVGTTDRIQNETLPLLKKLFSTNSHTKRLIRNISKVHHVNPSSAGKAPIQRAALSEKAIEEISQKTVWDLELYRTVQDVFSYDQWDSFNR